MNKVILMGRLTKDPDVKYTQGEKPTAVAKFTLAVDRNARDAGADFISCVAFDKSGEFFEKFGRKGTKFIIEGRIGTGNYTDKDGNKHYTTDVIVERSEFAESRASSSNQNAKPEESKKSDGFMETPDIPDEELPFH